LLYRVGILERVSEQLNAANMEAFRRGLRELGYIEGKNVVLHYQSADGRADRFAELANELVRSGVHLITARGTPATLAAKNAAPSLPIVMAASGDPVGAKLIASLARPGGNITGLSATTSDLVGKRIELLRELVPGTARLAALMNMSNPAVSAEWKQLEAATRHAHIDVQLFDVGKRDDLELAFEAAVQGGSQALLVGIDDLTQMERQVIAQLAARYRLPAIYFGREFVEAGGLISYGVN